MDMRYYEKVLKKCLVAVILSKRKASCTSKNTIFMSVNLLNIRINKSIKLLDTNIQKYANEFLVSSNEIEVLVDFDEVKTIKVFLVHDDPLNSYKVYYVEIENEFGLICVLENNNWWAMGLYGEFNVALYSM